ncbi:MAG: M48 family metalloprotease [Planctomycetes bacterium]|nr:M48 family metalloprotease [Planctomycetota bacterium]
MIAVFVWALGVWLIAITLWLAARVCLWVNRPAIAHLFCVVAMMRLVIPPILWIELPVYEYLRDAIVPRTETSLGQVEGSIEHANSFSIVQPALFAIWCVGVVVVLSMTFLRLARCRRRIRGLRPAAGVLQQQVRELTPELGLRPVPDVVVDRASTAPFVVRTGLRATVVLPVEFLTKASFDIREAVLIHELAHLRRRDDFVRFLEVVALALWWWVPLVYALRRSMRDFEELCCDAWVVALRPQVRVDYAAALIEFGSKSRLEPSLGGEAMMTAMSVAGDLERRIRNLSQRSPVVRWTTRARIASSIVILLALLPAFGCQSVDSRSDLADWHDARTVTVLGEIEGDAQRVAAGSTILELFAQDVRVKDQADIRDVAVVRFGRAGGAPTTIHVDVRHMVLYGVTSNNICLQNGDLVYVPRRGR